MFSVAIMLRYQHQVIVLSRKYTIVSEDMFGGVEQI